METTPINSVIAADDYSDHWFTSSVADYVDEDYDPVETLTNLRHILGACGKLAEFFEDAEGCGVIFRDGFRDAYFAVGYEAFREALQKLIASSSLDRFCSGTLWQELYDLNTAYDNEVGYYIQNDELGLKTLSRFMRLVKPDVKYYFGGTLDYHF